MGTAGGIDAATSIGIVALIKVSQLHRFLPIDRHA
jgi:hypothetical protein